MRYIHGYSVHLSLKQCSSIFSSIIDDYQKIMESRRLIPNRYVSIIIATLVYYRKLLFINSAHPVRTYCIHTGWLLTTTTVTWHGQVECNSWKACNGSSFYESLPEKRCRHCNSSNCEPNNDDYSQWRITYSRDHSRLPEF